MEKFSAALVPLIWTLNDFPRMNWHDCRIHAFAFLLQSEELVLDIDYITYWQRRGDSEPFLIWKSPATLVFRTVYFINISMDSQQGEFTIDSVDRTDERVTPNGKGADWLWRLECQEGLITFRASGFTQFLRRRPVASDHLWFSDEERSNPSFYRGLEE